jgi:hypothetical protein
MSICEVSFLIERNGTGVVYKVIARFAPGQHKLWGPPQLLHESHYYDAARTAHLRAIQAATREDWPSLTCAHG